LLGMSLRGISRISRAIVVMGGVLGDL